MSNSLEFDIDGRHFRARRLNARQQFHLSRRLAPLLPPIGRMLVAKREDGGGFLLMGLLDRKSQELTPQELGQLLDLVEPMTQALAAMRDEDADKIFEETLASVQVESPTAPGTWLPVWVSKGEASLVPELNDFPTLVPIIIRVVVFNLGNFMNGFPTNRGEPSQPQTADGERSPVARIG